MANRCEVCPLRGEPDELSCPGIWDWPGWCGHVRNGHHHFTPDKLLERSGQPRPQAKAAPLSKFPPFLPPDGRARFGFVSAGAFLGGAEMHGSNLFDYCDPSLIRLEGTAVHHEPTVPTIPTVIANWEEHGPVRFGPVAIAELARNVDILVTWGIQSRDLERLIPKDLPVIEISHCAFDYGQSQCAMPRSTVVAVSRAALRGVPSERRDTATIINNAIAPDRVKVLKSRAEVRAAWGVPLDAMVMLQTSRLSWHDKNPAPWIDGVNRLPGRWWGVWLGAGLDEHRIREYAAKVSPHRVVFPGSTDDVGSAMAAADCLVMTSDSEGYCYAIAEAWRAGLPVISKAVGVFEESSRFARLLPMDATGQDVAVAVVRDEFDAEGTADRVRRARAFAETVLTIEEFGKRWTDVIVSSSGPVPGPKLCDCGDGVWVGSAVACVEQNHKFDRSIHIYRDDTGSVCPNHGDGENSLLVHWREHDPVESVDLMRPSLAEVAAFAKVPGKLLVHCFGGVTRGPSVALAAKIARGCDPAKAGADIRAAFLRDRGHKVWWHEHIVREIIAAIPPSNPHKRNLELVRTCPHRGDVVPNSGPCNCTRYCLIGKGSIRPGDARPSVALAECLKCVGTS